MITSASNQKIRQLVQWNLKAKARRDDGIFMVEGIRMFREAPEDRIREVYVSEGFYRKCDCREKLEQCGFEIVANDIFRKISDTVTPQGILCVLQRFHYTMNEILQKEHPFIMILEDLQDPGNLGTILRTGEGAGIDGIIMSRDTVDIYNPKTIRATMGSVYRVPFIYEETLQKPVMLLKASGVTIYAAHLNGSGFYDEADCRSAVAFMIGNEGNGLSDAAVALADGCIRIPMEGRVESLNAAVAASLLMYETNRQRRERISRIVQP